MRTSRTTILMSILLTAAVSSFGQTSISSSVNSKVTDAITQSNTGVSAEAPKKQEKVVIITGTRFAYPLVQKLIDDYNAYNPNAQIIIEARGSADPKADILIEAYEPSEEVKKGREYVYFARYAVLPVANSKSAFAKTYADKGLNRDLINQLFFHDMFADKEKETKIKEPFTIYTRLQKAGSPIVFTKYFGHEQKDVKGKAIAGADEHLLKTLLRDSIGVTYLPLTLIYDPTTKKPVSNVTVLPVDLNDNGRVSNEEKFYGDLSAVIQKLENTDSKEIKNIPIEHLHFSVDKNNTNAAAVEFLRWVIKNGRNSVHDYGYLAPDAKRLEEEKFEQFASKFSNP